MYETKAYGHNNINFPDGLPKYVGEYTYDKTEDSCTVYNMQEGRIDGLKEFILKKWRPQLNIRFGAISSDEQILIDNNSNQLQ